MLVFPTHYDLCLWAVSGIRYDERHPGRVSEEQKRVSGKYKNLRRPTSSPEY